MYVRCNSVSNPNTQKKINKKTKERKKCEVQPNVTSGSVLLNLQPEMYKNTYNEYSQVIPSLELCALGHTMVLMTKCGTTSHSK